VAAQAAATPNIEELVGKESFTQLDVAELLMGRFRAYPIAQVKVKSGKVGLLDQVLRFSQSNSIYDSRSDYSKFHPGNFYFKFTTGSKRTVRLPNRKLSWSGTYTATAVYKYLTSSSGLRPGVKPKDALRALETFKRGEFRLEFGLEVRPSIEGVDKFLELYEELTDELAGIADAIVFLQEDAEDDLAKGMSDERFLAFAREQKNLRLNSPALDAYRRYLRELQKSLTRWPGDSKDAINALKALIEDPPDSNSAFGTPMIGVSIVSSKARLFLDLYKQQYELEQEVTQALKELDSFVYELRMQAPEYLEAIAALKVLKQQSGGKLSLKDLELIARSQRFSLNAFKYQIVRLIIARRLVKEGKRAEFKTGVFTLKKKLDAIKGGGEFH